MASTTPIVILGTTVQIPLSGDAPNWAPAIVEAFQLIAQALNISAGSFDVPPQIFLMTSNVNTNVNVTNLSFPTSTVSGSIIFYSVARSTTSSGATTVNQSGIIELNYNPAGATNNKWAISTDYDGPGADITFSITDTGQVQFSTTAITGSNHTGFIYFRALSVLNNT